MWSLFIYFLIIMIPGLFAALVYNLLCCNKMDCFRTITSALVFDLLILGINLAGLRFIKGIYSFQDLNVYFHCLSFTSKYILLSLIVGIGLAVLACLLLRLFNYCRRHFHHGHNNCNKNKPC
jgi:hypothetical protein